MPTAKEIHLELLEAHQKYIAGIPSRIAKEDGILEQADTLRSCGLNDRVQQAQASKGILNALLDADRANGRQFPHHPFVSAGTMQLILLKYYLRATHISNYVGPLPAVALHALEKAMSIATNEYDEESEWYPVYRERRWPRPTLWRNMRTNEERTAWKEPPSPPRLNLYVLAPVNEVRNVTLTTKVGAVVNLDCHALCLKVEHGYIMLCSWDKDGNDTGVFNIQKP